MNNPLVNRPLQVAGVISILMAAGHTTMGQNELAPTVNKMGLAARTALKGWYQGSFMYAVFGLNYLRLAKTVGPLQGVDKIILAAQAAMHLFTISGLEQVPPRALSALLLVLIGGGVATR